MKAEIFDARSCLLGEGPLWHPLRQQLFWFDILNKKLMSCIGAQDREWQFDEYVSAAGWITKTDLLIASETQLFTFNVETSEVGQSFVLEADNAITRSNDGRADPWGGFWIGTMGKKAQTAAGSIYRFYQGEIVSLYSGLTIPNSICFSPDRQFGYYADTASQQIMRQALDDNGWPKGQASVFIDLTEEGLNPDGSVIDADGALWNAQWGAARVARYASDGQYVSKIPMPARQVTCPAFGGHNLRTLFATSASEGLKNPSADDGATFHHMLEVAGQQEHFVKL